MNTLFERLMGEATQLTTQGDLFAATEAIQRALRGGGPAQPSTAPSSSAVPSSSAAAERNSGIVLDGLTRVVDDSADAGRVDASPDDTAPERWTDGSFTHQGRTLTYKLFVPAMPEAQRGSQRPLVVMLHGCTQSAADFAAGTRMNALAREAGVLVLYPEQTQRANAQRCWNWFKTQHQQRGRGEPALLAALTQSVMAAHQVDPARVYVAGLSAGGAMADVLGHCYPDLFAAVGVHSGLPHGSASDVMSALSTMRQGADASASPVHASSPPVIVFHGDADTTVHPANGQALVKAARATAQRASAPQTRAHVIEGRSPGGQRYTRTLDEASDGRANVEHWALHGAGHAWAGGSGDGSYTDPTGVDASAEMLRFFMAQKNGTVI